MELVRILIATIILTGTTIATPAMAGDEAAQTSNISEATELAEVLVAASLSEAALDVSLDQITKAIFEGQPDLALMNETFPGLDTVFVNTMRPIIRDELKRIEPLYIADLAAFYGKNFTAKELLELTTFWKSSAAQNILRATMENMDYAAISGEVVAQIEEDKDVKISDQALEKDVNVGVRAATKKATRAEQSALLRFGLSPAGRKFISLKEEKKAIDAKWVNANTSPEVDARIEADIVKAMEAHIASFDEIDGIAPTT